MRNQLLDVLSKTARLFDALKFTVSGDREITIIGWDTSQHLFVVGTLTNDVPEFAGDFAITNLKLLDGLLNFPNYKTDDAVITAKKREIDGSTTIESLEFRNPKTKNFSDFRLRNTKLMKTPKIVKPDWDVTVTLDAGKLAEFEKLVSLYKEFDKDFGLHIKDGDLYATIGTQSSATQSTQMVLVEGVDSELRSGLVWSMAMFQAVIGQVGKTPTIKVARGGVMSISTKSEHGVYEYLIRAKRV
jgi:hypothetical protein